MTKDIHTTRDKHFSSLFSLKGPKSDYLYRKALAKLGLENIVDFVSVEENCARVLKSTDVENLLPGGPEGSYIVDVPGKGDCWLIALLSPMLGFVINEGDYRIINSVRQKMSDLVLEEPEKFAHIFKDGMAGLRLWSKEVKTQGKWAVIRRWRCLIGSHGFLSMF